MKFVKNVMAAAMAMIAILIISACASPHLPDDGSTSVMLNGGDAPVVEDYLADVRSLPSDSDNNGGVGVKINFKNADNSKSIKKMDIEVMAINRIGDTVFTNHGRGSPRATFGVIGPIAPGEEKSLTSEAIWHDPYLEKVNIESIRIWFMDDDYVGLTESNHEATTGGRFRSFEP